MLSRCACAQCLNQDDSKPIVNALKAGAKCVLARRRCSPRLAASAAELPCSRLSRRAVGRARSPPGSRTTPSCRVTQTSSCSSTSRSARYAPRRLICRSPTDRADCRVPHRYLTRVADLSPAADCEGPEHHYQVAGRRYVYRQPVLLPRDAPRGGRVHHRNMRACLQLRAPQGAAQRR